MNIEPVTCAICGINDAEIVANKGDLTEDITNVVCRRCGLAYINPRPTVSEYESFHVESFLRERHGVTDPKDVAHKVDGNDLRMKSAVLEFLRPVLQPGVRVLDVGCGFGTLLHLIKKEIPDARVEGIELARVDVEAAKRFYGLDLFEGSLAKYVETHPDARFDLIILHHTFEHFPEPRAELARMKRMLAPGGVIYIAVPDITDIRKRPEIFFQLGHPYSYSPASLRTMLAAEGYAVVSFNPDAAFPGGMELLAEAASPTRPEVPSSETSAGAKAADVIASVRGAERRFARLRGFRDRALFFLPESARIAITRPFAQLMKRGIGKRGWLAMLIVASLLTSVLFNLKNILLFRDAYQAGAVYTFFTFLNPDAMQNLAPMIRDVLDGHWFPADGRVIYDAVLPNLWSVTDPALFSPFLFLTRSVPLAFLLGRIVIVALSYPIAYLIALRVVRRRAFAAVSAAVFLLAPLLWYHLPPVSLESLLILARTFLPLGSPPGEIELAKYNSYSIYPALPFTLAGLYVILAALERPGRRAGGIVGLLLGFLAVSYMTNAVYLGAIWGIALLVSFRKRIRESLALLVWSGAGAALAVAPFLWNYIHIRALSHAAEFFRRLGGDFTHEFRWDAWPQYLAYALFAAVAYRVAARRGRPDLAAFLAGCVLSAMAVLNLQVITGYNPAPTVWKIHQLFFGFAIAWLALLSGVFDWVRSRLPRGRLIAAAAAPALALMIAGRAVYAEAYAFGYTRGLARLPDPYRDAVVWLDTHTRADAVVATPSLATNSLIPYLTHDASLIAKAVTSPASDDEIVDRLLVSYALFDVSPRHLELGLRRKIAIEDPFFRNAENGLVTWLFEYRFVGTGLNEFLRGGSRDVPEDVLQSLVARYERYPRRPGYLLGRYRVDYLFVGPIERQIMRADFDRLPYLEKVYDANGVRIYAVRRDAARSL